MMSLVPLEKRDYLGGAAMVAKHLAGLGGEPTLICSLGTDDASDAAMDDLEAAGVHVLPIRNRKKIAMKTRFVVDTQKLFTLDESPTTPTDSANERYIHEQVRKLAAPASSLVMYDAGLGLLTDALASNILITVHGQGSPEERYGKLIGGTAGSRGRILRMLDADLLVTSERGLRVAMRDHEQGVSALAYRLLNDARGRAMLMPLGKKGLLAFDAQEVGTAGQAWEGKLRSEYLASPFNGHTTGIDRLGFDEALLAVAAGMLGGGGNVHQAAYVALAGAILESRQMGHHPLDGHELRQILDGRAELAE